MPSSTLRVRRGAALRTDSTSSSAVSAVNTPCTANRLPMGAVSNTSPNSSAPFQNTKLHAM
ncbi:hypothetical protein [Eggerthella sinensis]|uniref:hypothetical protein n=1 Tax=Eggerthella sinensis TaxID=242230 RepID=UPI0022E8580C|nr:hypothetical protein [Eggerthella sinensis]